MTTLPQAQYAKEINFKSDSSPFMHFLARELQQIYMLELRTNQLIKQLLRKTVYQPLKKAMLNYQNVSKDHLSCLRKLGVRSSKVSKDNKRASELLVLPLTEELGRNKSGEKLSDISMITGIQRIIFYQMAVYRSLYTTARKLYKFGWAESFDDIINDKKMNDSIFSEIALSGVYPVAIES